ncbi:MAG: aspartyl protease family protein [Cyclobacteriaceae bacterium]
MGQVFGFKLPKGAKRIVVPFKEYNNLVVVPVTINKTLTLDFIVDTGVQNAILTEKVFTDVLGLEYQRKISIAGPGLIDSVTAFICNNIQISLPGGISASRSSLLVLETDYLQLKNNMGAEIYGIIGYDLFSRFVVEINYDNNEITFHDPKFFKKKRYMKKIPITVERTKPYIETLIKYTDGSEADSIRLMVDSGASHALLLDPEDDTSIEVPEETITTNLGKGLGGSIDGKIGRIEKYYFDDLTFSQVLASFPDPGIYNKNIKRGSRSGTIGGDILSRINPVFDYQKENIYYYKGKRYKKSFAYDMSGMQITAFGPKLQLAIIEFVREGSPAHIAGIRRGDIIKRFNGDNIKNISLSKIFTELRRKEGAKIRMKIVRNGEEMKKCFRLRRLI